MGTQIDQSMVSDEFQEGDYSCGQCGRCIDNFDRYQEDHPECHPSSESHDLPYIYFSSEEESTHENDHSESDIPKTP